MLKTNCKKIITVILTTILMLPLMTIYSSAENNNNKKYLYIPEITDNDIEILNFSHESIESFKIEKTLDKFTPKFMEMMRKDKTIPFVKIKIISEKSHVYIEMKDVKITEDTISTEYIDDYKQPVEHITLSAKDLRFIVD